MPQGWSEVQVCEGVIVLKARTPQELADILELFMVRNSGVWYGCRNEPKWSHRCKCWLIETAGVEVMFLWHDVLFLGEDVESLHRPMRERQMTGTFIEGLEVKGCKDCPVQKGCERFSKRLAGAVDETDEQIVLETKPRDCRVSDMEVFL